MPPTTRPPSAMGPFHPPSDTATYKDLLLFEERLRMNASMLKRRKRRYEAFLVVLIIAIFFLANKILFQPPQLPLARYFGQGLLAVALVTLVLFFASGMYQERIGYANQYVPHANRSLRSLNMHLNMRRPPRTLRSVVSWILFLSSTPAAAGTRNGGSPTPLPTRNTTSNSSSPASSTTASLIPPIPPTTNPRGELIFSSRVDKGFREGYERYRAAFERRRAEKLKEVRWERRWGWWMRSVGRMFHRTQQGGDVPSQGTVGAVGQGQSTQRRRAAANPSPDRRGLQPTPVVAAVSGVGAKCSTSNLKS